MSHLEEQQFAILSSNYRSEQEINSVDAEGSKVMDDLRNEAFKEIVKSIMKQ